MGFAARLIEMLVARIKGLGFLEWAGIASLVDTILTYDVKQQAFDLVVEYATAGAGIQLDSNDPFSDASIAGALSQKTGIAIRSVKDRAILEEDVDTYAAGRISEKLGFQISSLRDPARLRADFEAAALAIVTEKTGIPFVPPEGGGAMSAEEIKTQVENWARARITTELSTSATQALEVLGGPGVDFEALAAEMNGKLQALGSSEVVTAKGLALKVAETLVSSSVAKFHATAIGSSKKARRILQLREAQRKFRSAHGNRQVYVPLGMSAQIS